MCASGAPTARKSAGHSKLREKIFIESIGKGETFQHFSVAVDLDWKVD